MKKLILFAFVLLSLSVNSWAQIKIALLEPRVGEGSTDVSSMEKAMVRGELRKAIVNHGGYEAFTRADIDQLMKEQDFQRTGMVNETDIKRLGEMSGADYICISTLSKSQAEFYVEAYLINVETGSISNPASQYGELVGGKLANMLPVCQSLAKELISNAGKTSVAGTYGKSADKDSVAVGGVLGSGKPLTYDRGRLYDGVEKLKKKQLRTILSPDEYFSYRSGRRLRNWGNVMFFAGIPISVAVGCLLLEWTHDEENLLYVGGGGTVGFVAIGITLKAVGKNKIKKVAQNYNARNMLTLNPTTVGFSDGLGHTHLAPGLSLSFNF